MLIDVVALEVGGVRQHQVGEGDHLALEGVAPTRKGIAYSVRVLAG